MATVSCSSSKRLIHGLIQLKRTVGCRRFSISSVCRQPKIAVIGSGPAAFYFTAPILRLLESCTVDLFEKLPVPFGLVRFGVAPDHPEVKNCINQFQKTVNTSEGRVNFRGNVTIGKDITVTELRSLYDAVVFCSGAESEKTLGVTGEWSKNCVSARSFVGWYNGHPDFSGLEVNLDTEVAAILGHGNVALDVARILLTPVDVLAKTDITNYALEKLKSSRIKRVTLIGRRGPMEVALTIKEFREMLKLPECEHFIELSHCHVIRDQLKQKAIPRAKKRLMELILKTAETSVDIEKLQSERNSKLWELKFLRSPTQVLVDQNDTVYGLELACNDLEFDETTGSMKSVPTGSLEHFNSGLVVKSLGYKSLRIPDLPFDEALQVIPTSDGYRVDDCPGVYASGWSSRGPTGVIASTQIEAKNCAVVVADDFKSGNILESSGKKGLDAADALLQSRDVKIVTWADWQKMDEEEQSHGAKIGKPREKLNWTQKAKPTH